MSDLKQLGPWPLGVNNVDPDSNDAFQPATQPGQLPAQLRAAVNLDLDKDGWPRRRVGRTKLATLIDGHSGQSVGGLHLVVDNGTLCQALDDGRLISLMSGVGPRPLRAIESAGMIWWTNGEQCGRLVGGVPVPWGLQTPAQPMASVQANGPLAAGRYLVTITVETADGLESGAPPAAVVELASAGAIVLSGLPTDQPWINVYASSLNGRIPYWVRRIPAAATFTLDQVDLSTDPCDGIGAYPPPPGQALAEFSGRILIASGPALYWSGPAMPHHFKLATDVQLFGAYIDLLAVVPDGFYVRAGSETVFVSGNDPETWTRRVVDSKPGAEGCSYVLARKLPKLQADGLVPVWVSADGPVVGLPGGRLAPLTEGRVAMDTFAQASVGYREENGIRQILMTLRNRQATNRLGATDAATCTVVRAGDC